MRIHVSFIDRVGITQEVLAILGGRNLNLDAVEMIPPNVYIDAPTLSPQVLEELKDALFRVLGVEAVTVVDILPGQRRQGAAGQPGADCPVRSRTGRRKRLGAVQ
jgi:transcriptional regulator of aromatic amino acid metabolism